MKKRFRRNISFFAASAILVGAILLTTFSTAEVIAQVQPPSGEEFEEIDLSDWVIEYSRLGITKFRAGEFFMRAKRRGGYFYVLVAPPGYSSEGHNTRVTLRNVSGRRTKLGYGLLFHSNPEPLAQDYSFVIDTVTRRYRVIRHKSHKELTVIKWTRSRYIRPGKRLNMLEVKDRGETVDLYINNHFVGSVETPFAFKDGQPGLYTDATNIAFKGFSLTEVDTTSR